MLGRPLKPDEVVHHRDDNKKNPYPANLQILTENDHNAVSSKQYWFLRRLQEKEKKRWEEFFAQEHEPVSNVGDDVPF